MKRFLLLFLIATTALAGQWQGSEWNSGVNVKNTATGFYVDLPSGDGHINIVRRGQGSIPLKSTITVTYRVKVLSGAPKIISLDPAPIPPGLKPNFRPALFTGDWYDTNGRQWPAGAACMFLVPDGRVHTYSIKVTPQLWTNVYGKYDAAGFKKCAANMHEFWFAWGAGNSFTHGLKTKGGTLRVEVLSVKVVKP